MIDLSIFILLFLNGYLLTNYVKKRLNFKWFNLELQDYKLLNTTKQPFGISLNIQCINRGSFEQLESLTEIFEKIYQCKAHINNIDFSNKLTIDIVKNQPNLSYQYINLSPYQLLIGYDYMSNPIIINMKVTPHLGVVGLSNNGKSKCIELALKNLRGADIHLINCMKTDFVGIGQRRINNEFDILDYFYYITHDETIRVKPLYIVIDEYNVLSKTKGVDEGIEDLLRQARHRNVFVIVIMQQGTRDEVTFKNLFNCRLAFRLLDKPSYYSFLGTTVNDNNLKQREFILVHTKTEYGMSYLL